MQDVSLRLLPRAEIELATANPNRALRTKDCLSCLRVIPSRRVPTLAEDVRSGLLDEPRSLPPKYFYDARGARLFEKICTLPEYYPTRTETALLRSAGRTIIDNVRPQRILELGSGAATKTRLLFDACESLDLGTVYAPFDVCEDMLQRSAAGLVRDYPWLEVTPLIGDFSAGLAGLPPQPGSTLYVFLGSSIGNFTPAAAVEFLRDIRAQMHAGDALLIGFDRFKNAAILHAAYNDSAGVTADFNRNLLHVLNGELGADFNPAAYRHEALVNPVARRVEMYLVATTRQSIWLSALHCRLRLAAGERILTELSHKYDRRDIGRLLTAADLAASRHFTPANEWFSLVLATPASA